MTKIYVVRQSASSHRTLHTDDDRPRRSRSRPTCGSGTTAYVAEQWGRRWITIDTVRVALALARSRLMGARYPYYLLADSPEGQRKEAEITRPAEDQPTHGDIRQGFVYERVPHITLKSIANNAEIDVIWESGRRRWSPCAQSSTPRSARPGRNGKSRARPIPNGRDTAETSFTQNGGRRGSRGRRRSTPRSPPRPSVEYSTTSPMSTMPASASPAPSPSRACRRIARSRSIGTTS